MAYKSIKCTTCNNFNTNVTHCTTCNSPLLSYKEKQVQKEAAVKQKLIEEAAYKKEHPNIAERLKKHPFFLYRVVGWVLYSAIMVVSIIGASLAWLIAMIAAG